jgi:hypothetical protein
MPAVGGDHRAMRRPLEIIAPTCLAVASIALAGCAGAADRPDAVPVAGTLAGTVSLAASLSHRLAGQRARERAVLRRLAAQNARLARATSATFVQPPPPPPPSPASTCTSPPSDLIRVLLDVLTLGLAEIAFSDEHCAGSAQPAERVDVGPAPPPPGTLGALERAAASVGTVQIDVDAARRSVLATQARLRAARLIGADDVSCTITAGDVDVRVGLRNAGHVAVDAFVRATYSYAGGPIAQRRVATQPPVARVRVGPGERRLVTIDAGRPAGPVIAACSPRLLDVRLPRRQPDPVA